MPKIRILDRYIFWELIPSFFLGLFVFTFVMLSNIIIQLMDMVITRGVGLRITIKLLGLSIPFLLVMTIPMSVLLAVLVAFSRFSADSEMTAMKSSGISINRLMPPVMVFALLAYILTSVIYVAVLPRTNLMLKQIKFDIIRTKANIGIRPHVFNTDFIHLVIYTDRVVHNEGRLEGIFIADNRNLDKPIVIVAKEGYEYFDPLQNMVKLRLENGCTHELYRGHHQRYSLTPFQQMDLNLDMTLFKQETVSKSDREMTIQELLVKARKNEAEGRNSNRQWVEIWKKTSLPFACIVFAFIAVPLGISTRRGGKSSSFAISIGIILAYYILLTGGTGLAEEKQLPALLATWLPNLLLASVGVYFYYRLITETPHIWVESLRAFLLQLRLKLNSIINQSGTRTNKNKIPPLRFYRVGRILDRYFIRQFLRMFLYIELALTSISIIVHAFEKIDDLVENNASLVDSIVAVGFKVPYFAYLALPFAVLVATILVIGLFFKSSEMTAMKASGISYFRAIIPLISVGAVISVIAFLSNESLIPLFNRRVEMAWDRIKKRERTRFIKYHRWYRGQTGDIYYFQHFDPQKDVIGGFSQFHLDDGMNILSRTETDEMIWQGDRWYCPSAREITMNPACQIEQDVASIDHFVDIPETPQDFSKEHKESDEMNIRELREYIQLLRQVGIDTVEYEVDWHAKFAIPFLCFIMSLIGAAFASQDPRAAGGLKGIGLSIFIGVLCFLLFRMGLEIGQADKIPPIAAAWLFNIICVFGGALMLRRANTH